MQLRGGAATDSFGALKVGTRVSSVEGAHVCHFCVPPHANHGVTAAGVPPCCACVQRHLHRTSVGREGPAGFEKRGARSSSAEILPVVRHVKLFMEDRLFLTPRQNGSPLLSEMHLT